MTSFAEKCAEAGLRMTAQRRLIADVIEQSDDHPGAEAIHARTREKNRRVSLATVYRTIDLFEKEGVLRRIDIEGGGARYEINRTPHEHLVDVETGQIHEFRNRKLESLIGEIAAEMGFEMTKHRLEIFGRKNGREKCRCYQIKVY